MYTQVLVNLPEDVYRRAKRLAQLTAREVSDILADTIEWTLPSLPSQFEDAKPIPSLSDDEVLNLAELQMDAAQNQKLSELLYAQQAGVLTDKKRSELWGLMQIYQEGLLRKARALNEAVKRGLREPLKP